MKHLTLLAAATAVICLAASVLGFPVAKDIAAEIAQADPRSVLSSSSHHIPDDDPLVSIFVDILHDGDGETDPEPYEGGEKVGHPEGVAVAPKEAMRKRNLLEALKDETGSDSSDDTSEESEEERDNRIGKFVNIHVAIDNRGNGNGDGLVNIPM